MGSRDSCNIWVSIHITNKDQLEQVKNKIVKRLVTPAVNGAISFRKLEDKLYLTSYYDRIFRITDNLDLAGQLPIAFQDPADGNDGIAYVRSIDFWSDESTSTSLLAVVSQARHLVRIYDGASVPLSQIGVYDNRGNVADNKLSEPRDCLFLPNGNLLVVSRFGRGVGGSGNGHVSEYDRTGALVASRLEFYGDGESAIGKNIVRQPTRIKFDSTGDYLWVAEYEGRLLKVRVEDWLVEDMVFCPGGVESFCFLGDGNIASPSVGAIAIASLDLGGVAIINPESKELLDVLDPSVVGATREVRDVVELDDLYLAVTCWSNRREDRGVYLLPREKYFWVDYEPPKIPDGYGLARDLLPLGYDPEINSLKVNLNCLDNVPDQLAIPLRLVC